MATTTKPSKLICKVDQISPPPGVDSGSTMFAVDASDGFRFLSGPGYLDFLNRLMPDAIEQARKQAERFHTIPVADETKMLEKHYGHVEMVQRDGYRFCFRWIADTKSPIDVERYNRLSY